MDITLECSPNTFHRFQTDLEHREKVTDDLLKRNMNENQDSVPNIIVTEIRGAVEAGAGDKANAKLASEIESELLEESMVEG